MMAQSRTNVPTAWLEREYNNTPTTAPNMKMMLRMLRILKNRSRGCSSSPRRWRGMGFSFVSFISIAFFVYGLLIRHALMVGKPPRGIYSLPFTILVISSNSSSLRSMVLRRNFAEPGSSFVPFLFMACLRSILRRLCASRWGVPVRRGTSCAQG